MLWLNMAVELPAVVEPPLPMGKQCAISPKRSLTGKQDANICVPALRGRVFCVRPICSRQHMPGAVLRVCRGGWLQEESIVGLKITTTNKM